MSAEKVATIAAYLRKGFPDSEVEHRFNASTDQHVFKLQLVPGGAHLVMFAPATWKDLDGDELCGLLDVYQTVKSLQNASVSTTVVMTRLGPKVIQYTAWFAIKRGNADEALFRSYTRCYVLRCS